MEAPQGKISPKKFNKKNISMDKEIGSGSFGRVYKATIRDSKFSTVAIKVFWEEIQNSKSKQRQRAYDELSRAAMLEHENVVKLIGMVEDKTPWLIFEYMKDGNLLEFVLKNTYKEKTLIRFCRDITNGMAYLHYNNILHKDLAARNILLDGKRAKVADLGLSSLLNEADAGSYALGGKLFPYRHAAVECIVEEIYTFETDVWAFGVLMWEMWTSGRTPYGRENKQPEVRRMIVEGNNPTDFVKPPSSTNIDQIFKAIFQTNREIRPSFQDLTPIFDSILRGGKVQLPTVRSREQSPFRGDELPMKSSSDEKLAVPSANSNKMLSSPHGKQISEGDEKTKFLSVRTPSPLSTSTPNLHAATFHQPKTHIRPKIPKEHKGRENNFYVGSPPGKQLMSQFSPSIKEETDFGGRRYSDVPAVPDPQFSKRESDEALHLRLAFQNSAMERATSFTNILNSTRVPFEPRHNGTSSLHPHSVRNDDFGRKASHGSQSHIEPNGLIVNRFRPKNLYH